jgi:hypothetical protein
MKRKVILIIVCALLLLGGAYFVRRSRPSHPNTSNVAFGAWRASAKLAHEGGPSIVFEFTRTNTTWAGTFFMLDPNQPDNFAIALSSPIQIDGISDRDIRFTVVWPSDHFRDEMVLHFDESLVEAEVHATLEGCDVFGVPTDYQFLRTPTAYAIPSRSASASALALKYTKISDGVYAPSLEMNQIGR